MQASQFLAPREIYYFVPKASCRAITEWIQQHVPVLPCYVHLQLLRLFQESHFHCNFINWAGVLAQSVQRDSKKLAEISAGEQQVYQVLREGFPITDPEKYVVALEFYLKSTFLHGMRPGPLGKSYNYARGFLKPEDYDSDDAMREGRYKLFSYVFSKKERDEHKRLYARFELMTMHSSLDLDDITEVAKVETPMEYDMATGMWYNPEAMTGSVDGYGGAMPQIPVEDEEMDQGPDEPFAQEGWEEEMMMAVDAEPTGDTVGEWRGEVAFVSRE